MAPRKARGSTEGRSPSVGGRWGVSPQLTFRGWVGGQKNARDTGKQPESGAPLRAPPLACEAKGANSAEFGNITAPRLEYVKYTRMPRTCPYHPAHGWHYRPAQ